MQHDSDDPPSLSPLSDVIEEEEEEEGTSEEIFEEEFVETADDVQLHYIAQDIDDDSEEFEEFERMIANEYNYQPEKAEGPSLAPQTLHVEAVDVKQLSTHDFASSPDNSQVLSLESYDEGVPSRGVVLRTDAVVHEYEQGEYSHEYDSDSVGSAESAGYYNEETEEYPDEYQIPLSLTEIEESGRYKDEPRYDIKKEYDDPVDEEVVQMTTGYPIPQINVQEYNSEPLFHDDEQTELQTPQNMSACSDEEKIKTQLKNSMKSMRCYNVNNLHLIRKSTADGKDTYNVSIQLSKTVDCLEYTDNSVSLTSAASLGKLAENMQKLPECQHRDQVFRIIDKLATCMAYLTDMNKEYRNDQNIERNRMYGSMDYMPYYAAERNNRYYDTERASPVNRCRNFVNSEDEFFFVQRQARRQRHSQIEIPTPADLPSPNPNDTLEDQIKQCLHNTTSLETLLTINNPQPLSRIKQLSKSLPNMNLKSREELSLSTIESKSSSIDEHKKSTDSSEKCNTRDASTHTDTQSSDLLNLAENNDETGMKAKAKLKEVKRIEKELEACVKLSESLEDMIIDYVEKKDFENEKGLTWKSSSMPDIRHKRYPMSMGCGLSTPVLNDSSRLYYSVDKTSLKKPRYRKLYPNLDDTSSDSYKTKKSNIRRQTKMRSDLRLDLPRSRSLSSSATASSTTDNVNMRDGLRSPALFKMVRFRKHSGPIDTIMTPDSDNADHSDKSSDVLTTSDTKSPENVPVVTLSQDEERTRISSSNIVHAERGQHLLTAPKSKETQVSPTLNKPLSLQTQTSLPNYNAVETQMTPVGISNQGIQIPDEPSYTPSSNTDHTSDDDENSLPSSKQKNSQGKNYPNKAKKMVNSQNRKEASNQDAVKVGEPSSVAGTPIQSKYHAIPENVNSDKYDVSIVQDGISPSSVEHPQEHYIEPTLSAFKDADRISNQEFCDPSESGTSINWVPRTPQDTNPEKRDQDVGRSILDENNRLISKSIDQERHNQHDLYPKETTSLPDDKRSHDSYHFQNPLSKDSSAPKVANTSTKTNHPQKMGDNTGLTNEVPQTYEDFNDYPMLKVMKGDILESKVPADMTDDDPYNDSRDSSGLPYNYQNVTPISKTDNQSCRTPDNGQKLTNYSEPLKSSSRPYESSEYPTSSHTINKHNPNEITDLYLNTSVFSSQTVPQNTPVDLGLGSSAAFRHPNTFMALIPKQETDGPANYVNYPTMGFLVPPDYFTQNKGPSQPQTTERLLDDYFQPWSKSWKSFKDTASQTQSSEKDKTDTKSSEKYDNISSSTTSEVPFSTSASQGSYKLVKHTSNRVSLQSKPVRTRKPRARHHASYIKCANCTAITDVKDQHCHSPVRVCKKHNAVVMKKGEKHVYTLNKTGRKVKCIRNHNPVPLPNSNQRHMKTLTYYVNDDNPKNRRLRELCREKVRPDTPANYSYDESYEDEDYNDDVENDDPDPTLNFSTNFHTSSPERKDCSLGGGVISEEGEKQANFMVGVQQTDLARYKKRDDYDKIHTILRNMNVSQKRCLNIIKEIQHNK